MALNDSGNIQIRPDGFALIEPLSLRDWFAGQALGGLTAIHPVGDPFESEPARDRWTTKRAYEIADAMLLARERKAEA